MSMHEDKTWNLAGRITERLLSEAEAYQQLNSLQKKVIRFVIKDAILNDRKRHRRRGPEKHHGGAA